MFMLLSSSPRRFPLVLCQNFSSVFFFLLSGPGRCSCCFKRLFRSMETVCKVMRLLPYFVDNHRKPCAVSSMQLIHPYQQNLGTWYSFFSTWLGCFMAVYFILLRWCYTRRFATTIFSATQRCNVGTTLLPFETMSQQYCKPVLR